MFARGKVCMLNTGIQFKPDKQCKSVKIEPEHQSNEGTYGTKEFIELCEVIHEVRKSERRNHRQESGYNWPWRKKMPFCFSLGRQVIQEGYAEESKPDNYQRFANEEHVIGTVHFYVVMHHQLLNERFAEKHDKRSNGDKQVEDNDEGGCN